MRFMACGGALLVLAALGGCGDDGGGGDGGGIDSGGPRDGGVDTGGPVDGGGDDAGGGDDGGDLRDGGGGVDGGGDRDGGSGVPDGVRCVGAEMDCAAGEICCGGALATTCVDPDTACRGDRLACDGPEDCPGQLCCEVIGMGLGRDTSCMDMCTVRICHSDDDCAERATCCPNGGGTPTGALSHCTVLPEGSPCPLPP